MLDRNLHKAQLPTFANLCIQTSFSIFGLYVSCLNEVVKDSLFDLNEQFNWVQFFDYWD